MGSEGIVGEEAAHIPERYDSVYNARAREFFKNVRLVKEWRVGGSQKLFFFLSFLFSRHGHVSQGRNFHLSGGLLGLFHRGGAGAQGRCTRSGC